MSLKVLGFNERSIMNAARWSCDADGCETAIEYDEVIAGGGLTRLGWQSAAGKHFCPKHNQKEIHR